MTNTFLAIITMLIRREAQRVRQFGHDLDTAVAIVSARGI